MQTATFLYHWRILQRVGIFITIISLVFSLFLGSIYLIAINSPKPSLFVQSNTYFLDNDKNVIGKSQLLQNRKNVKIENVPPIAIESLLISEDRDFYEHHGFNLKRIGSALVTDLLEGHYAEGASTITQQLAKNLYLTQEKTLTRKLREAFLTIKLETSYTKDKLLEAYLNTIYFGHGVYGLETAANAYLGKSSKQLNVAESTFLLSIPANPSKFDPYLHFSELKKRQERILSSLVQNHVITKKTAQEASKETIHLKKVRQPSSSTFSAYFQQSVQDETMKIFGQSIQNNGSQIITTYNSSIQKAVEHAIKTYVNPVKDLQVSVIVLDSQNGDVLGMVGGKEQGQFLFNRAVASKRQIGSTIKPILYYGALVNGFTPSTRLMSKPTTFQFENGEKYAPKNSGNQYAYEPITLAKAIAVSDNIYAVKTQQAIGTKEFIKVQNLFHLPKASEKVPSLSLGTGEASLLDMTRAYAMIANGGKDVNPHFVNEVISNSGRVIFQTKNSSKHILKKDETYILKQLMNGMFNPTFTSYLPVTGSSILPELNQKYYGKTGTTKTDSWMIGFHSTNVVGVWIGYDRSKELSIDDQKIAKKVWASIIKKIPNGKESAAPPKNLVKAAVDEKTGYLFKNGCSGKVTLYYRKNSVPTKPCNKKVKLEKRKKAWYEAYLP